MNEQEIKLGLDLLADYMVQRDNLMVHKQTLIDEVMNAEIKAKLAEIDADFNVGAERINENIEGLGSELKSEVLALGTSVKSTVLHAVWNKGRVSWDTKSLDGYALAHPELLPYRKEGEPSVSIRPVTKKEEV
jgi:hypothetical protein